MSIEKAAVGNRQAVTFESFVYPISVHHINYYTTQIYNIMIVVTSTMNNKRESI